MTKPKQSRAKTPKELRVKLPPPLTGVQKLMLFEHFDWGSIEGRPYRHVNAKWAKEEVTQGTIGTVEHIDRGHAMACYNEQGVQLFVIGQGHPWEWSFKSGVLTVSFEKTARVQQDLGPVPFTEYDKFEIDLS